MHRVFPSPARRQSGFTLVELLVSLGVIAILASILLSASSTAQESANRTKCLGNIKQLGGALTQYAADNNNFGPYDGREAGIDSPAILRAGQSLILFGQLLPYLISDPDKYLASVSQTPEVFLCPSTERKMLAAYRAPVGPGGLQYTRYFMNTDVSTNPLKKTSLLVFPGRTITIVDFCLWWSAASGLDENHKGKGLNCIRLDGSAGWISKKDTLNLPGWNFEALSRNGTGQQ